MEHISNYLLQQYGANVLHHAAKNDDVDLIRMLLATGVDVNQQNEYGNTALFFVTSIEAVRLLINAGIDINHQNNHNNTVLHKACNVIGLMMATEDAEDQEAACETVYSIIQLLLDSGANVNAQNDDGDSCLHKICDTNIWPYFPILEISTPFTKLVNTDLINLLLTSGANINLPNNKGRTPLYYTHTVATARLLLSNGADVNHQDMDGNTALHLVYDIPIVTVLLETANINLHNKSDQSALDTAIADRRFGIAKLLSGIDNHKFDNWVEQLSADICPICRETINDVCITDCAHAFCKECIDMWRTTEHTHCPLCREPL